MAMQSAHQGWSGPALSDDELMKEGVRRDSESANSVDQSVTSSDAGIHNQLGVLPSANVLNRFTRLRGNNSC